MIVFKTIRYKNFLSTGNQFNTIELNKHSSTLITGKNGEGKSTILCALTFSLFGKPFRNVNKNQLINSINKKNCVVEIEFTVGGRDYRVIRGIKPNVFEIYCDGNLINQDAASKDYQKVLEQQILKLNYKTFTQVVILGSATFVPFMQLPAAQRREVIEDILDIKIFSVMNVLLKDKIAETKQELDNIEHEISQQKIKIESQKKLIDTLVVSKNNTIANLQEKIESNNTQIDQAQTQLNVLVDEVKQLSDKYSKYREVDDAVSKTTKMKMVVATKIDTCQHDVDFFTTNDTCPSCAQVIASDHKEKILADLESKIATHRHKFDEVNAVLTKLNSKVDGLKAIHDDMVSKNIDISVLNNTIAMLSTHNASLRKEINSAESDCGNIDDEKSKLRQLAEQAIDQVQAKTALLEHRNLQDVASLLLKDTGIKTAIIREYLPVINKLINKYLAAMDFYVKIELDESFTETIKSRGRDAFTYDSFSEGEKRRLDLAILFTWRQIAKMKNSVNTNIMILDEILDGALDGAGIDYFLSVMDTFGDQTNVFVITHKVHQMIDRFDNVIRVEKKNDFSVITLS